MIFDAAGGIAEVKAKLLVYLQMGGWPKEECGPLDFSSTFWQVDFALPSKEALRH
jgi:hypothetical protein